MRLLEQSPTVTGDRATLARTRMEQMRDCLWCPSVVPKEPKAAGSPVCCAILVGAAESDVIDIMSVIREG